MVLNLERQATRYGVGQGPTDEDLAVSGLIIPDRDVHAAMERIRRLVRDDVDGAARRVAAVECALGSAQDLDPIDVIERGKGTCRAGIEHPVLIEGDAALGARGDVIEPDATEREPRLTH